MMLVGTLLEFLLNLIEIRCQVSFLVHFFHRVAHEEKKKLSAHFVHFVVECSLTIFGRSR